MKMPTKRTKGKVDVKQELTPDNLVGPVRRSPRKALAPKRLEYSPDEKTNETLQRKRRKESHGERKKPASLQALKEEYSNGGLSAYELERLENIKKNQEFLSSLNILQVSKELRQSSRPKASPRGLGRSQAVQSNVLPPRRSMRLQNKDAKVLELPPEPKEVSIYEQPQAFKKPPGPLPMEPVNSSERGRLPAQLLELWNENSTDKGKTKMDLQQYRTVLSRMKITEDRVAKVVKYRIFSAAFHPCTSSLLMAAGDKWGQVGLWNLCGTWGDDGVLLFKVHTRPVTCMAFSKANPAHLLSVSYDGSMRSMDVEKAVFTDVYDIENCLKTFDFLSHDSQSLLVGSLYGDIAVVDRRTPGNSHESLHILDTKNIRSVNVHPLQRQYFAVAESMVVSIYDSRFLKKTKTQPVCQLKGHTKSIHGAYFSPDTGNHILTSCMDSYIRIYDTSATTTAPLLKSIRHDMNTGRWLTQLSAVWDPKQEDCFVVGSMARQRCVQVFHQSGQLLHCFTDDNLTTVQSVVAFHPTRNALLGGNSTGRLHVFAE